MAAGVTLRRGDLGAFRAHMIERLAATVGAARAVTTLAIDAALAARGVQDQFVGAIAPKAGAIRFYQSRGFRPAWLELTRF
jgi:hypothetical protein